MARATPFTRNYTDPSLITSPPYLTSQTHWIRNTLDLQIAQNGPEALTANDLLDIDSFLRGLLAHASEIPLSTLRGTRIHLAVLDICGRATRWPLKVIERAETIGQVWEGKFGSLSAVGWEVGVEGWEEVVGGRKSVGLGGLSGLSIGKARRFGDLGFRPGDWWINPLFAYRAGILDSSDSQGGIVADSKGAYAVLLTGADEVLCHAPEKFVYRARNGDKGRYRLTAATIDSRHPVRVLRSHTLRSLWSPRAGIRYEGLYKVSSWSIVRDPQTKKMVYDITFKRLESEGGMDSVLQRPWTEEIEDYKSYKKFKAEAREERLEAVRHSVQNDPARAVAASDGAVDERVDEMVDGDSDDEDWRVYEDETAESPKGSVVVVRDSMMIDGRAVLRERHAQGGH